MGKAKSSEKRGKPNTSPYHVFFQRELKRIKAENPSMSHKEAFKQAGLNWRESPQNPKNQKAGAPAPSKDQLDAGSSEQAPLAPAAPATAPKQAAAPAPESVAPALPTVPPQAPALAELAPKVDQAPSEPALAPPSALPSLQSERSDAVDPAPVVTGAHPGLVDKPAAERSAEPQTDAPAKKADESAGTSAPAPVIPSMAAHAVTGTLAAAK
ncbi:hypothetical protein IWW51_003166 [Coemansia sp. RSA 2702]|nr:hypothetical protein IWW54_005561 [Coemansia sp. RSA 2705]KAJ2324660.1 hypothetical protein IWW51_003166 [Coemansia sp. RSA 2702]